MLPRVSPDSYRYGVLTVLCSNPYCHRDATALIYKTLAASKDSLLQAIDMYKMTMKHFTFLFFLLMLLGNVYAQTPNTIPGYYVSNTNDTVNAQIKLPQYIFSNKAMLVKFTEKVAIVDSTNESRVFRANDIKAFGFLYDENRYQLLSKDFGRENAFSASTHRFYQAIILGQKSNLYHGSTTVDASGRILSIVYFLEKPNGTNTAIYLFPRTKPEFIRNLLKQFYKDNAEIHPLIDSKFQSKIFETWQNDVMEIVQTVNRL